MELGTTSAVEVVTGADHLATPRWTADGLTIVVGGGLGDGRTGLFVVPRLGGAPRRIADQPSAYDTHPTADSIVLVLNSADGATLQVQALAAGEQAPTRRDSVSVAISEVAWSPDGTMFAATTADYSLLLLGRDATVLSRHELEHLRGPIRWSADGRYLMSFVWGTGSEDDLLALPVGRAGAVGHPRLMTSRLVTMLRGRFDVARTTGRVVVESGTMTSDLWSFDLQGPGAATARRLTQGSGWYGPPVLSGDGGTIYYLRQDGLGNNLYAITGGRERVLTAEPQIVENAARLSLDGRVVAFETSSDSGTALAVYDLVTGRFRRLARGRQDRGWMVRSGQTVVWLNSGSRSASITDSAGSNRRPLAVPSIGALSSNGGWALAPDGRSVALLGEGMDAYTLVRVPLDGSPAAVLGTILKPSSDTTVFDPSGFINAIGMGVAAWSADGIYLATGGPVQGTRS